MTDGGSEDVRVPGPGTAALLLLIVAALFLLGGLPLQLAFGEAGLLMAQVGFLFVPVLVCLHKGGFDTRRTLSLRFPSLRQTIGGMLFLGGGLQLALVLSWLQAFVIPVPVDYLEAMSGVLVANSVPRYLWLLLLAALVPAVVEETLFRGVMLTAFRKKLPTLVAVVAAGLVFGLFHLTPVTAFRFLPTAWLGTLLAWVVVASGSLPLAMFLHFLNNAAVLTAAAMPLMADASRPLEDQEPPVLIFLLGTGLFFWGLRVLHRTQPAASIDS